MKFQLGPHLRVLVEAGLQHKPKTTKRTFRKSSAGKIRRRGERIQTAEQDLHPARNSNEAGPEKQFGPGIAPGRKTGIPNDLTPPLLLLTPPLLLLTPPLLLLT